MSAMGNLFDVAMLIGVGFLIVSLTSFGLKELVSKSEVTIVKNPGRPDMELITKSKSGEIRRLKGSGRQAEGEGAAVGTVYRLNNGQMVWVPSGTGK
jgi:hypothetical protein